MIGWVAVAAAAAAASDPCADADAVAEASAEIKQMYEAGEADRADRSASAESVLDRDEERAKAAAKLDKKRRLCTVEDKWYAAWLMTQSDSLAVLERAYELAVETQDAHYANGPWLVAFTFDLKRVAGGYNQAYGTRTQINERNQRCLVFLEGDITDEQRALFGQPAIAEVYRRTLDLNGYKDDPATLDAVKRRGLYCEPVAVTKSRTKRIAQPE